MVKGRSGFHNEVVGVVSWLFFGAPRGEQTGLEGKTQPPHEHPW